MFSKNSLLKTIKLKWHEAIAIASLVAIFVHIALKFFHPSLQNFPLFFLIIFGGLPVLIQILLKIIRGNLGVDVLAFIELVAAVYLSEYLAAALIILMVASGGALESYAIRKASFALQALVKRMPSIAHRKIKNSTTDISISEIKIGDLIEIYPHEICPVDGTVAEGYGSMDESYLTGEPYSISKAPGSLVLSGAINGNSPLVIQADKLAKDSRYSVIIKVMENAENSRPQIRRLADQIGAVFAPLALAFSILVFYLTKSATTFLAVLVVATPCPLLIAVPVVIISAISIAARHGIIIRNPAILEKLPTCVTAIFDKTGTLTYGKPELVDIFTFNGFEKNSVLQRVASIERYSRHPLSQAVIKAATNARIEILEVDDVIEKPGQGLVGNILGQKVLVTSRKKLGETIDAAGLPPVQLGLECVVVINDKIAAIFHFRDVPRHEGHSFINHLGPKHNFKKVILASGDRSIEVKYLASLLGIKEIYAEQTPEQKLELVRKENAEAPTLFVGDGINDAPALAVATASIAFGEQGGVTSEAAGAVIMESSLVKVDQLIHLSELMRKIALQSAVGGMLLSIVGMGFAAAGFITPVYAALLQEVIDVVAILNSLRLTWKSSIIADVK